VATEPVVYISYEDAVYAHVELMRNLGETRYGITDRGLIKSALARPLQAAAYGEADLITQAATLLYGLIKNHPWVGGNKRTATTITQLFLRRNGFRITSSTNELVEMVLAVEADEWQLPEIETWLHHHVKRVVIVTSSYPQD
jgi:death-on-curing protein